MSLDQAFRVAVTILWSNKMRSALTMLGVVIGVFAVVALVSIGQGATGMVTEQVREMGSNLITVTIRGRGAVTALTIEEAAALVEREGVAAAAPVISGQVTVDSGARSVVTLLEGTTADYQSVRNHYAERGRFLTFTDVRHRQNVALLGSDVAAELFPGEEPLERQVRIGGAIFTVVGVLESKGDGFAGSQDDKVIIPVSTAQRLVQAAGVNTVYVQAAGPELVDRLAASLEAALQLRFRDEEAYQVFSQAVILETMDQITATLTLMLGGIAGISLLVGGIGIMNIMLVSVTERTREIGVCKALGAKKRDILLQFLIESAVLSSAGGLAGLLLGYAAVRIFSSLVGLTAVFTPEVVITALLFSLSVGIFFGIYPANKAARLNPIEALRTE